MDPNSTQRGQMPPPERRSYKRTSAREWDQQRDRIRELFIDQGKTHEDVRRILRENHGFDVGLRQLKRKTDFWGFVKNIPNKEMEKMVRIEKRRGKATKFIRKHGAGEFQDVSPERLGRFRKRFRPNTVSSMSTSSGTPSNIMYHTPSNGHDTPHSNNPATVQSNREATMEFNNSVGQIFSDGTNDSLSYQADSPSLSMRRSGAIPFYDTPSKLSTSARNNAYDGDYKVAGQKYHLAGLRYAEKYGSSNWLAVGAEFSAAAMKAAEFAGCPQSIAARIAQELSRFLMRERQKHIHSNRQTTSSIELRKTLTCLKMNANWCNSLLVQQRAIQIWEPALGSEHPKIQRMYDDIASMRFRPAINLDTQTSRIEEEGAYFGQGFDPENIPHMNFIADLLHLEDGSADDRLEKFRALENSDLKGRRLREELALLRYGRSRSILGGYYSFLGKYDNAEKAFQASGRYMQYEVCVEIKLHRILWYAEHKTRTRDWDTMWTLLFQAHSVYMKNEKFSEYILTHFPDRFERLCLAASKQAPIDEVVNETFNDSAFERLQREKSPASIQPNSVPGPSSSPNLIPSPERLFPPTPSGFNSGISVETWRHLTTLPHQ